MSDNTTDAVTVRARALLADGSLTGHWLSAHGDVDVPIPVVDPAGQVQSWLVPVVAAEVIAGYFRVGPGGDDWSWSGFMRHEASLAGCPPAELWLNRKEIAARAAALAVPGETVGTPVLSYDAVPDRVAWAVPLRGASGNTRVIYVAGRSAWQSAGGPGESTGGPHS